MAVQLNLYECDAFGNARSFDRNGGISRSFEKRLSSKAMVAPVVYLCFRARLVWRHYEIIPGVPSGLQRTQTRNAIRKMTCPIPLPDSSSIIAAQGRG